MTEREEQLRNELERLKLRYKAMERALEFIRDESTEDSQESLGYCKARADLALHIHGNGV